MVYMFMCMSDRKFTTNLVCCVCGRRICGYVGEKKECDLCLNETEVVFSDAGSESFVGRERSWRRNFAIYGGKTCLQAK